MNKLTITCTRFRKIGRNTLRGFATVGLPELHLTIRDVAIHEHSNGSRWASLPAKPMLDSGGQTKRNAGGKIEYATILEFEGRGVRDAFSQGVIRAVLEFDPNALTAE